MPRRFRSGSQEALMLRDRVPRQSFTASIDQSDGPVGYVCGHALVERMNLRRPHHRASYAYLVLPLRNGIRVRGTDHGHRGHGAAGTTRCPRTRVLRRGVDGLGPQRSQMIRPSEIPDASGMALEAVARPRSPCRWWMGCLASARLALAPRTGRGKTLRHHNGTGVG